MEEGRIYDYFMQDSVLVPAVNNFINVSNVLNEVFEDSLIRQILACKVSRLKSW
jgi:hypothetical protein